MENKKDKYVLREQTGDFDFDDLILDENGKFINENTKIEADEENKIVTFTNFCPNGEIQRMILKLRKKR